MAGSDRGLPCLTVQLPLNPSAPLEATGNIPLAGASLAAAASLPPSCVLDQAEADTLGDRALLDMFLDRDPGLVAFTLYMWNAERSVWLARALKRERPDVIIVAGGPEVSADNRWLLESGAFDLLVSGEGEAIAGSVLDPAVAGKLPGSSGGFISTGPGYSSPGSYPNPWLTGYLDPSRASVHLETVRGCSGGCEYCSYRRSHPVPRMMEAAQVMRMLKTVTERGAREIVFLDPTFNARPDLPVLLRAMRNLDAELFAEMRGDLITPDMAAMIHDAGFRSVEIGLQSCSRRVLELVGRAGDPVGVLEGAANLMRAGVTPVIDIMLGLPGDTPENAVETAKMVRDRDLHRHLQVFYLSVLPGTAMRERFRGSCMDRPPYYRFSDPDMGGYASAREEIADIAGYDLDLGPRPLLFDGWPGTETLNTANGGGLQPDPPSFRHGCLRVVSGDPWAERNRILEVVKIRREAEPFCVLDLVMIPGKEFPLDLVKMVREIQRPMDYSGRTAEILGREGSLRVAVLLPDINAFSRDWARSAAEECTVAVNVPDPSLLDADLWESGVCARLPGSDWDMGRLASSVPSMHQVLFAEREMEERWSRAMDI
ncbi:MAG: radical SAM protein [Candidatus Aegiribacteria sp.]